MSKIIVRLGTNKGNKNDDSSPKLTYLQKSLLMIIVETPENAVSHGEVKSLTSKVHEYYVQSC